MYSLERLFWLVDNHWISDKTFEYLIENYEYQHWLDLQEEI
jgi:hypothetical protein